MGRATRRNPTKISQSVGAVVGHQVDVESEIGRDVTYATQLLMIDRDVIHSVKHMESEMDHDITYVIPTTVIDRDVIHAVRDLTKNRDARRSVTTGINGPGDGDARVRSNQLIKRM